METKQDQIYNYLRNNATSKATAKAPYEVLYALGVINDPNRMPAWNKGLDSWFRAFANVVSIYTDQFSTDNEGRYYFNPSKPDLV